MIKTGLIATVIAAAIMAGMTIWTINGLPATGEIPVHWNYKGEADGFAPVAKAKQILWMVPGISIFTSLIFAIALKVDPRRQNIERSRRAYMAIWMSTLVLMTLVTGLVCYSMLKGANAPSTSMEAMPKIITGASSILFLIIGNYLPKTRSNWFFGIRTPWTLSSNEAWQKTHRLAGRLFVLLGIIGLLSAFLLPLTWQLPIIIGGSLLVTFSTLVYSYLSWRGASDRQTAPDYLD